MHWVASDLPIEVLHRTEKGKKNLFKICSSRADIKGVYIFLARTKRSTGEQKGGKAVEVRRDSYRPASKSIHREETRREEDADPGPVRVRRGGVPGVGGGGSAGRASAAALLLRPHPGTPHRPPLHLIPIFLFQFQGKIHHLTISPLLFSPI